MSLLYFIVIGLIAGWLAAKLIRGGGFGLLGNMVIGMIGAVIGGSLMNMAGVSAGSGLFASIGVATIGAIVLLFLVSLFRR
ncbi:MAG: GlsB/YeaQ/YmgE family stress response membrane protein [Moraxellaceae bacterium]|nr:GlsB/YeaQ/YmgE family stress response membrane protein [Moraxellaceae bacterium]MDZ4386218.1 GlsB/YeaQ/YmgE family stress response membrane protein [Moraxellaceae bacterium]